MKIQKNDLISMVAVDNDISFQKAASLVDSIFNNIGKELRKGNDVIVKGFGTFRTHNTTKTKISFGNKTIAVPKRKYVKFLTGEVLRRVLHRKANHIY